MGKIKITFRKTLDILEGRTCRVFPQVQAGERLFALKAKDSALVEMVEQEDYNDADCLYFTVEAGQTIPRHREIFDYELAFEDSANSGSDYSSEYEVYVKDDDMVTRVTLGNAGLYAYMKFHEDEKGTELVDTDILNEMIRGQFYFSGDAEFLEYFEVDEINW